MSGTDHPRDTQYRGDGPIDGTDGLSDFIEKAIGDEHLRVDEDFGHGFVRLKGSEAQRRQAAQDIRSSEDILIELLRNSRDADASNIFIATTRTDDMRTIVVIDDGSGIPQEMFDRVFEPRVTSKLDTSHMDMWGLHGRGMALYSIKVNATDASVLRSRLGGGSAIRTVSDASTLDERVDQSTFPHFEVVDGKHVMRGPKNLIRTAVEFALEHRGDVSVYMGSPAEVVATMYAYGLSVIPAARRAFIANKEGEALFKELSFAPDCAALVDAAADVGLQISERTARRIMDGAIKPLPTLLDLLSAKALTGVRTATQRAAKRKGAGEEGVEVHRAAERTISLTDDDVQELASAASEAFAAIAERYYLDKGVIPRVESRSGRLVISIPTIEDGDPS